MLGMMQGKGGEQATQPVQGQQPMGGGMGNLAALFNNNAPAAGGGGMPSAPLPQITQPQRPTIAPPMARPIPAAPSTLPPAPAGIQQTARQKQVANFSPRYQQWLNRRDTDNR